MPPFKSHTSSFRLFKVNCEQSCKGMNYVVHFFYNMYIMIHFIFMVKMASHIRNNKNNQGLK